MLKAIETRYRGYRFRSRLEARWAVYFDTIGLRWEYEPQGFKFACGPYLPDFWLPQVEMWAEVKPVEFTSEEMARVCALATESRHPVLMLVGVPDLIPYWAHEGDYPDDHDCPPTMDYILSNGYLDEGRFFGSTGMSRGERIDPRFFSDVARAVEAARSARFEHGETP